jgi:hypothetical protein
MGRTVIRLVGVDREEHEARQTELLIRRFGHCGAMVDDAVPAFTGMYPAFNGFGTWELLFTRWRILALAQNKVQVWTAWTGPTPKRLVTSADRHKIDVAPTSASYARVTVARSRLWVHSRHLAALDGWRGEPPLPEGE